MRQRSGTDIDGLEELARMVHGHDGYPPRGADDLRGFIASADALDAWVAEIDGIVVGQVVLNTTSSPGVVGLASTALDHPAERLGVVARLLVHPNTRGRGVGGRLLETAADGARERGLCPILDVASHFDTAIRLYEHAGWVRLGTVTVRFPHDAPLEEFVYSACRHRPLNQ